MPRTVKVSLGSKAYVVTELPRGENKAWLKKVVTPFQALGKQIDGLAEIELNDWSDLKTLVTQSAGRVLQLISTDHMLELLYAYSPELNADKKAIEADPELYDSEISTAFVAVVTMASPFGAVAKLARSLTSLGATASTTP